MKLNKKTVIAYLFTHWDREWYRTVSAFNVRLVEIMDKVLLLLETGKIPYFYLDGQSLMLKDYLNFHPEKKPLIKKLIKEKKLNIGPFYVSADNFLVSGASLIKNLEYGIDYSRQFGENSFIGYLSDTFGHSKGIFKILQYFNIENSIIWRGTPDISADFTMNDIKTTRLVYGYYQDILQNNLPIGKKAEMTEKTLDKIAIKSNNIILLPLGGDHLAPAADSKIQINEINKLLKNYQIKIASPFEYINKADYTKLKTDGEFLDNSATYILQGVYSTRTDEKKENAILQYELFYKLALFNKFLGNKYKAEINYANIELIKNHAHDSIYGCSTDKTHKIIRARQLKVKETIKTVKNCLIRDFKNKNLLDENENKIGVFNFSNYPQNGIIKIITDKKLKNAQKTRTLNSASDDIFYDTMKNPMTEDFHNFYEYLIETDKIPSFSFKNIEIKAPKVKHTIGTDFIENDFIKLFVFENKIFALDKKTNNLYENFIQIHSTKDNGDSYNYAPSSTPEVLEFKKSRILKKGKIKSTLQLSFEENIKLNFSITNNLDYVEIEADFINKNKNRKLQIVFNTNSPVLSSTAEDCIDLITRSHNPNYLLYENIPVKAKEELKTNAYPMQRFVTVNNLTVFTIGLNEYEIYKNNLKIALLRSIGLISNPKNPARGIPAGPPVECPDMQGIKAHNFNIAFSFGCNNPFEIADNFYGAFIGILGEFKIKNKNFIKNNKGIFYGLTNKGKPVFYKDDKLI